MFLSLGPRELVCSSNWCSRCMLLWCFRNSVFADHSRVTASRFLATATACVAKSVSWINGVAAPRLQWWVFDDFPLFARIIFPLYSCFQASSGVAASRFLSFMVCLSLLCFDEITIGVKVIEGWNNRVSLDTDVGTKDCDGEGDGLGERDVTKEWKRDVNKKKSREKAMQKRRSREKMSRERERERDSEMRVRGKSCHGKGREKEVKRHMRQQKEASRGRPAERKRCRGKEMSRERDVKRKNVRWRWSPQVRGLKLWWLNNDVLHQRVYWYTTCSVSWLWNITATPIGKTLPTLW